MYKSVVHCEFQVGDGVDLVEFNSVMRLWLGATLVCAWPSCALYQNLSVNSPCTNPYHLNQQLLCLVAAGPKMQLACPPCGVSLPQAEQTCTPDFPTYKLFDVVWETKIRDLMVPKGSFAFCSCFSSVQSVMILVDDRRGRSSDGTSQKRNRATAFVLVAL